MAAAFAELRHFERNTEPDIENVPAVSIAPLGTPVVPEVQNWKLTAPLTSRFGSAPARGKSAKTIAGTLTPPTCASNSGPVTMSRPDVVEDLFDFMRRQPPVERRRHQARLVEREEQFQIGGAVLVEDGDAIAGREAELLDQTGCKPRTRRRARRSYATVPRTTPPAARDDAARANAAAPRSFACDRLLAATLRGNASRLSPMRS